MKYWILTSEYPPFHGGGISTYCYFTVQMLSTRGYTITLFVQDDSVSDYAVSIQDSATIVRFNSNRNKLHQCLGYTARLSYAFADMVKIWVEKEGKPDCIEAQDYLGIAYYLSQYKHLGYEFARDIPLVITMHSPAFLYLEYNRVPTYRFPDFWTCEMEKHSLVAADMLISPTGYIARQIQEYIDISRRDVRVLPNPYAQDEAPAGSFTPDKILYYGKLSPQKGSFHLLEYFKKLWDEGFPHPLHMVGDTEIVFHPEMQTMGQIVQKKYHSYIGKGLLRLHGKIPPARIKEVLQDAHVIVVPSTVDNLPYVVMEAMHLGKLVLASAQGGQVEMVEDGVTGFVFDHREPASFERQLKKILALPADEVLRIGANARRSVERLYAYDAIFARKDAMLRELTGSALQGDRFPFLYQEESRPAGAGIPANGVLSVVIPYYNMGKFIDECIESVSHSTYRDIEILIINDGSDDPSSLDRLEALSRNERITVIHGKNNGLAHARNHGAATAKGEYLAFLDADDKVAPGYYEKAIRVLREKGNVFFVGAWVKYFGNSADTWPTFTPQPPYVLVHNPVNSSGLVYKRAAFLAGGLNDKATGYGLEDYESVVQLMANGFNGVVLPETLFFYRVRSGSMIRNISTEKLMYSNKYIAEKHHHYYAKFATPVINILNANGPGYLFDNPTLEVSVTATVRGNKGLLPGLKSLARKNKRLKRLALSLKKLKF